MDRARLDQVSNEEVRQETQLQLKVTVVQDRASLIDAIMSHFERFHSALQEPTNSLFIIEEV